MDWERFGRTRKVGGEQRGVEVQCASMGAPTALIGYREEEEEEDLRIRLYGKNTTGITIVSIFINTIHR